MYGLVQSPIFPTYLLSTGRDELAAGVVIAALVEAGQVLKLPRQGVAGHSGQVCVGKLRAPSHHVLVTKLNATGAPIIRKSAKLGSFIRELFSSDRKSLCVCL